MTGGMAKYWIIPNVGDKELPRVGHQLASCSLLIFCFYEGRKEGRQERRERRKARKKGKKDGRKKGGKRRTEREKEEGREKEEKERSKEGQTRHSPFPYSVITF